jgi:hypothetical protein
MYWDDELEQLLLAAQDQDDPEAIYRSIHDTMSRLQTTEPAKWSQQLYGLRPSDVSAERYFEALRTALRKRVRPQ